MASSTASRKYASDARSNSNCNAGLSSLPTFSTITLIRAAEVCATAPTGNAWARKSTPHNLAITALQYSPDSCSQAWLSWRGSR
ncbi:hypothetical protein D3C77_753490 [compost metagenome]